MRFPSYKWTSEDAKAFRFAIEPIMDPVEVLRVYVCESGLNPHAQNGVAFGLCQATLSTLRVIGWKSSGANFAKLTVSQQVPYCRTLIQKQIDAIGYKPTNAQELYVANLSPLAAKKRSSVIYKAPSKAYEGNKGLDRGKKGYITPDDLGAAITRHSRDTVLLTVIKLLEDTK